MGKHTITQAEQMYHGKAEYAPLFGINGRRGIPVTPIMKLDMGTPVVGDANGFVVSQDVTDAGVFSVSTTVAAALAAAALAGVADVPRNIVAAWTTTSVMTVTGTDAYGETISEASASGTSHTGTKAFKTVTNITFSISVTSCTVGTGDVLGIPYFLTHESDVLGFYADATEEKLASVFVAGVTTTATTTTGDVRGTVDPDTTLNGSVRLYLWMHVRGTDLKSDLIGVTQA